MHFLFDEPGEELGTKRRRDGSSRQGLCGPRLTQLAHNTSYPAPDRDNRDHQDYRDVAEPFLKKPEGHPEIAPKARHGCLGGLGRLALPPILESCQIQWQSNPHPFGGQFDETVFWYNVSK